MLELSLFTLRSGTQEYDHYLKHMFNYDRNPDQLTVLTYPRKASVTLDAWILTSLFEVTEPYFLGQQCLSTDDGVVDFSRFFKGSTITAAGRVHLAAHLQSPWVSQLVLDDTQHLVDRIMSIPSQNQIAVVYDAPLHLAKLMQVTSIIWDELDDVLQGKCVLSSLIEMDEKIRTVFRRKPLTT